MAIPMWMLETAACCQMRAASSPCVSLEALVELSQLLAAAPRRSGAAEVIEAQHRSSSLTGGADATRSEPAAGDSQLKLSKAFTLMEPGPVVLVTTHDGKKNNIMTISWTMVLDFTPVFAITTGEWNHSIMALRKNRECVIAIPTVDMLDRVVGIGTCSGADTDKFAKFKLTPVYGKVVRAPLIKECLANIECKVIDIVRKHNIVVLEGLAAYMEPARQEWRTVHAVGDGTFIVDGRKLDRSKMMASKIPEGI